MGQVFRSWSASRAKAWRTCRRQWFFQYASKGETKAEAARLLCKLSSPEMEAGNIVETEIRWDLFNHRKNKPIVQLEDAVIRGQQELLRRVAESPAAVALMHRNRLPHRSNPPMYHDFYGKPYEQARVDKCLTGIRLCLENWRAGSIWERLQESDTSQWMTVPYPKSSARDMKEWWFEGIQVYSPSDFYFGDGQSTVVFDWKTGQEDPLYHAEQMAGYAAFAVHHLKKLITEVRTQLVYLRQNADYTPAPVAELVLSSVEAAIREGSKAELETAFTGPKGEEFWVDKSDFPAKPNRKECAWCNFVKLCPEGREVLNVAAGDPL